MAVLRVLLPLLVVVALSGCFEPEPEPAAPAATRSPVHAGTIGAGGATERFQVPEGVGEMQYEATVDCAPHTDVDVVIVGPRLRDEGDIVCPEPGATTVFGYAKDPAPGEWVFTLHANHVVRYTLNLRYCPQSC